MSKEQAYRAYRKLWARAFNDGYQPFGYDLRTIRLRRPGFLEAVARLERLAGIILIEG